MKPCPFCAGTKSHYNTKAKSYFAKRKAERERRDTANHLVRCTGCGAKGPLRSTEAEAIAAWNIRPAQGTSASGQDPQGLEAKPAGPVRQDAPHPNQDTPHE